MALYHVGFLDEEERPSYPDKQYLHVYWWWEVRRDSPWGQWRVESSGRVCPEEGCRDIWVPGEHGAQDKPGHNAQCRR